MSPWTKEQRKAYMKTHRQKPEVKEQRRKYAQEYKKRPEVKEHLRQYMKMYNQRPEVKKRRKEYYEQNKERHNKDMRKYSKKTRTDPDTIIRDCQRQYTQVCEKDPKEAKNLLAEMESEEGKEFRDMVLDGIPEKMKVVKPEDE